MTRIQQDPLFRPFPLPGILRRDPPSGDPLPAAAGRGQGIEARIHQLGEDLDAHRKRQQALHPDLTITGMYNVLEKLRSGEALTDKERVILETAVEQQKRVATLIP